MNKLITAIVAVVTGLTFAYALSPVPSIPGDDNGDGIVMEDESGWVCSEMGNRVCG